MSRPDYQYLVCTVDLTPKVTCPHARAPLDVRASSCDGDAHTHLTVVRMRAYALIRGKFSVYEYMKNNSLHHALKASIEDDVSSKD